MFKNKYKNIIEVILFLILLASLYPLINLAFFSRPCVDDFAYSYITHNYVASGDWNVFGLIAKAIETDVKFYNTWQGLYSSAFLLSLQPGIFGEQYYCIGMFILLIISYLSILYFISSILDILKIKLNKYLLSMFLFVMIIQALPNALSGLYWFNGAYNYMPFFFLSLINVGVSLKYISEGKKHHLISSCLLSLIISGGNHVTAFLNILLLICLSFVAYKKNKKLYISLIFALLGFSFVMFAPGTRIRQDTSSHQGTIKTMYMSFVQSIKYLLNWIDKKTIFIYLTNVLWGVYTFNNNKQLRNITKVSPLLFFLIAWIILCAMLCVPYMAMGFFGAERLTNVIWLFFIISTILLTTYSTWYLVSKYISFNTIDNTIMYKAFTLIIAFMCVFYGSCNSFKAYQEVYNCTAPLYAQSFDERLEKMNNATNNSKIIVVDALPYSAMLKIDDLTDDVNDWRNTSWEAYYGYKMIAIYK